MKSKDKTTQVKGAGKSQEDKNRAQYLMQKKRRAKERKAEEANAQAIELIQTKLTNARQTKVPYGGTKFFQRQSVVEGYREMVREMGPIMFVTFMPGYNIQPQSLRKNMKTFWNMLERITNKKRWAKFKRDRPTAIAFFEKPDTTPHYHALAAMPWEMAEVLEKVGDTIWAKLMRRGKIDIQYIYDRLPVIRYATKDLHHHWAPDNVYIYAPISPK